MLCALTGALLASLLQPGKAAEAGEPPQEDTSHTENGASIADIDGAHVEEAHELHAANAILFLFVALTVGIILRRAATGFIIPYTGVLVVCSRTIDKIRTSQCIICHILCLKSPQSGIARRLVRLGLARFDPYSMCSFAL